MESAEQSGGRQGAKRALTGQESSKQPVGRRSSGSAPAALEIAKRPRGCRLVLRPPSDQAGAKWPGRSPGAKRGEKRDQAQNGRPSTKSCRTDEGIKRPGERKVALETKSSEEGVGRVLCGCSADIVGAQIRTRVLGHPQRYIKLHPWEEPGRSFPIGEAEFH